MKRSIALALAVLAACAGEESAKEPTNEPAIAMKPSENPVQPTGKIEKTDAEWRRELTPEQYRVLRQAGTERPFEETYEEFKLQGTGTYRCAGCGALLFSSNEKFDSHCGWPSFFDPADAQNVVTKKDVSGGMARTEVLCARCGGHLGHVFTGEGFKTPTDQRYCINGIALEFVPAKDDSPPASGDE